MEKLKVAIVGYGNIGRFALEALEKAPDMDCVGIVRRNADRSGHPELEGYKVVSDISELGRTDVAILAVPSRNVEEQATKYLKMGISTVDSFDIHTSIWDIRRKLEQTAIENNAVSIISAGWDPGSDSVVRALMEMLAPEGTSYTNFGPGRSMGHSVAAKAIKGVRKALSMTIPEGKGVHSRQVYVEIEDGEDFGRIEKEIKGDPYFANDATTVTLVDDADALNSLGHGVDIVREGKSGNTDGQEMEFRMRINNPALTGQVLVGAARAAARQMCGCYTMIEVPLIDFLPGERREIIRHLV